MAVMPLLYAHRGAAAEYPENTIPSFQRAIEVGANALEMDVHLTRDGHVVVCHDDTGQRMAGKSAVVAHTDFSELQKWNVGANFCTPSGVRPFADETFTIPLLSEVLERFPEVPLNIDIKAHTEKAVRSVIEIIDAAHASQRVTLASFSYKTLRWVRAQGYSGRTSLAPAEVAMLYLSPKFVLKRIDNFGSAAQIPTKQGPVTLASGKLIEKCHDLNMEVHFWTINDIATAQSLIDLGADAIMTDDPAKLSVLF